MNNDIEKIIISEYKGGLSSIKISEKIKLSKPTILKVLRKYDLIRKRDRCSRLIFEKKGEYFTIERSCPRCKNIITTNSKDKTICCRNHLNKVNNNTLCKKCSLELQVGEGNPFFGKKHKKETKKKISKSRKGKGTGERNSMSNPKWKEKTIKKLKEKWNSGDLEKTRLIMSNHMKNTIRLGKIKSVNTSKKEKQIIDFLKKLGIQSVQSYRVETKICDIYIPKFNLIIEYFGDYWHCNPSKYDMNYFNQKKKKTALEIWEYDKTKLDLIRKMGYNLEVIWESELKHNNNKILDIIKNYDSKNNFAPERS
jgi:G:T-mismatch repair DNA endonuclease (very short patch repair protein)